MPIGRKVNSTPSELAGPFPSSLFVSDIDREVGSLCRWGTDIDFRRSFQYQRQICIRPNSLLLKLVYLFEFVANSRLNTEQVVAMSCAPLTIWVFAKRGHRPYWTASKLIQGIAPVISEDFDLWCRGIHRPTCEVCEQRSPSSRYNEACRQREGFVRPELMG